MISIIVPVYNVEKYLDACLTSLVNQTYQDIEIILVDDGSTDKSGIMVDKWAVKDSRIKIIHQANGGLSKARNTGIKLAQGSYLIFVDSDDIVSGKMVETLYNLVDGGDIAIGETLHIFEDTKIEFEESNEVIKYTATEAIKEIWYQRSFLPSAWGKIFKKELFNNLEFKEGIIFEDIEVMHELFASAKEIIYSKTQVYGYIHHEGSITTKPFSKKDLVIKDICDKILDYGKNHPDLYLASLAYYVVGALRIYLNAPSSMKIEINEAKEKIEKYGKEVLKDKFVRKKTKYSLFLFFYARFLLKPIYRRLNRWK